MIVFNYKQQIIIIVEIPGTAKLDRRGKPVPRGEWNPLPRDNGDYQHLIKSKLIIINHQFHQVIVLHREYTQGGSIGVTLAGGADYESKEITVSQDAAVVTMNFKIGAILSCLLCDIPSTVGASQYW